MKKNYDEANALSFIKGLTTLTGLPERRLIKYASENNLFNVLEHPSTIDPSEQQLEKINTLNEFLSTYKILKMQEQDTKLCLNSSLKAGEYFASMLGGVKNREKFLVAFLDNSNTVIETRTMSEGSLGEAVVYPRDILKAALDCDCKSIIVSHNHPGNTITPSNQDIDLTQRLVSIFTPINIKVLDHIIVANSSYYSMEEKGQMPAESPSKVNYNAVVISDKIKVGEYAAVKIDFKADVIDTMRIFFPLKIITYPKDEYGMVVNYAVDITPAEAVNYEDAILAAIAKENRHFENDRGLAEYIHDEALNKKVYSLYPSVEIVDGELWGVMTARLNESLSGKETEELLDFVTGQNSDGYGEGLEQGPVKTSEGDIYVSFWNHENYSIKLEQEMKNNSTDLGYGGQVMG